MHRYKSDVIALPTDTPKNYEAEKIRNLTRRLGQALEHLSPESLSRRLISGADPNKFFNMSWYDVDAGEIPEVQFTPLIYLLHRLVLRDDIDTIERISEMVSELLKAGARPELQASNYSRYLPIRARFNSVLWPIYQLTSSVDPIIADIIVSLYRCGLSAETILDDSVQQNILHAAATERNAHLIESLFKIEEFSHHFTEARINTVDDKNYTPLDSLINTLHLGDGTEPIARCAQVLIDHGCTYNTDIYTRLYLFEEIDLIKQIQAMFMAYDLKNKTTLQKQKVRL